MKKKKKSKDFSSSFSSEPGTVLHELLCSVHCTVSSIPGAVLHELHDRLSLDPVGEARHRLQQAGAAEL